MDTKNHRTPTTQIMRNAVPFTTKNGINQMPENSLQKFTKFKNLKGIGIIVLAFLIACLLIIPTASFAQVNSSYLCTVRNDSLLSSKIYEFDIYLLNTDPVVDMQLGSFQAGLVINAAIKNGGTITASIIAGTSQLSNAAQIPTSVTFTSSQNCIKLAPKSPPGAGSGSIISKIGSGTRICRIKLTNTVDFGSANPDFTFNYTAIPYNSVVASYDMTTGVNTNITNPASHLVSTMYNPLLNGALTSYNVTGSGSFCQGGAGLPVGIDGSQTNGVKYILYKGITAQGSYINGTGLSLNFGNQLAETYTVKGHRTATFMYLDMAGSAVISEYPATVGGAVTGGTTILSGATSGLLTLAAHTGTVLKWQSSIDNGNNWSDIVNNSTTFTSEPLTQTTWFRAVIQSGTCSPAYSLHTIVTVSSGPAVFNVTGSGSYCAGAAGLTVSLSGSESGVNYQLYKDAVAFESPIAGTGTGLAWNAMLAGSYTVIATNITTLATNNMNGSAIITESQTPSPVITGNISVCNGSTNTYTTDAGMTGYIWTVPSGGIILDGGTSTSNTVEIFWSSTGVKTLAVNYTNASGCIPATAGTLQVTVNALSIPAISGSATTCTGSETTYSTEAGKTNYTWTVSSGGTITSGATTNAIAVIWNTSGAQTVSVLYTNSYGCTSPTATIKNVTVYAAPTPTIAGLNSVCAGSTGIVYTTEAGMTNYVWNVSSGGTITAGKTVSNNTVTIIWNTAGAQTVSVNYTNGNGCTGATASVYNVTVNALPVPTITGLNTACAGTSVNYTTEAGMTAYSWTISAGGTITSGASTNTITVLWNTAGSQTVSANYTNGSGCTATVAAVKNVTVNPLPTPTIAGSNSLCESSSGNVYTTQPGMSAYAWSVSAGGTITAGGTSTDNTVTITWNTTGAQTVGVNYTNSNGCTAAAPTIFNVTVNAIPVPTITGASGACAGLTKTYTTEAGMTGYSWTVSAGGTITSGTLTNIVTVTWNTAGNQTISINYTNASGCASPSATIKNVTIYTLPVPTITGSNSVCAGSTGNVYTTQTGKTSYIWTVSAGGTITAGGTSTSSTVTVTWNSMGEKTVSVNYTNGNNCTAATAAVYNVTVNALPVPTITGLNTACAGTSVNYATEAGMTAYNWAISAGGTITSGASTNSITVLWNTAGPQTVSANYINGAGCTATAATVKNVTINPLPTPTISGADAVCEGTAGSVYTTQSGMSAYIWTVSAGGTITAGGTSTDNTVTIVWNTAGAQIVSVNYTNANGCTAATAAVYNVTVNALPVPAITGLNAACAGTSVNYTTEAGMTAYNWTISAGGTITSSASTNTITVLWNTAGSQTVSANYTNGSGCTATAATTKNVTVNPLPTPSLTGTNSVCKGTAGNVYTTQSGMSAYTWTVSAGGTITAGGTSADNMVTITWNTAGAQTVSVNYTNGTGCTAAAVALYNVTVNALPVPTITGLNAACAGTSANYTTEAGMTAYSWAISAGGTITSGESTNTITVLWNTAGPQTVSANYTNGAGCTATAAILKNVTVNPLPTPTISGADAVCEGTAGSVYTTQTGMSTYTWTVSAGGTITAGGTSTDNTITITWNTAGAQAVSVNYTNGNGCTADAAAVYNVTVNTLPVPAIGGNNAVCEGTSTNYTTEAGMTAYSWAISAGGAITSGESTNSITVLWNTAGSQTVSANYTNGAGCTATAATLMNVTVNPLPSPTITGINSVCEGTAGNIYTTQSGMSAYTWTVSAGGAITAGGTSTDNTVTITWEGAGAQLVGVNYENASGCQASSPSQFNINVNALPTASISYTGSPFCQTGTTAVTQTGQANGTYTATPAGLSIDSIFGEIDLEASLPGNYLITYSFSDGSCSNIATTSIIVNELPQASISYTGSPFCNTGTVTVTQSGQSGGVYSSTSGLIIDQNTGEINLELSTPGAYTITYLFTNGLCSNSAITSVIINAIPVPVVSGELSVCQLSSENIYTTESGMTAYSWTVSAGGIITSGTGTNSIAVTWNVAGNQSVSVSYLSSNGCAALTPAVLPVIVNPLPGNAGIIDGLSSLCVGTADVSYSIDPVENATSYVWELPEGATGLSTANSITITFTDLAASGFIKVKAVNECGESNQSELFVNVNTLPVADFSHSITFQGIPVLFTDLSTTTDGTVTNWEWNFGDGSTSTLQNPAHTYALPGDFTVQLTITTSLGCQQSIMKQVTINQYIPSNAPFTYTDSIGSPYNTSVTVPVKVNNFTDVTAISLRLDYDPNVLTFTGFSNLNPLLDGLMVNDNSISPTLNKVVISWSDINPVTLPDGSKMFDLVYTYNSGSTDLIWNNTENLGQACEYADVNGVPMIDEPSELYYQNGEVHYQPGWQLSGTYTYNNNALSPLDNMKIVLSQNGLSIDSVTTDVNGAYNFGLVQNGTYRLTAFTSKPWGGVNSTDAAKIQRHFIGIEPLNEPVRLLAGDVNNSQFMNATDALQVKRRFAGLTNYFLRGDWTFAKPATGGDTVIVIGSALTQNFYGLCVGDVNGSNMPVPGDWMNPRVELTSTGIIEVVPGQIFEFPIKALYGMQLSAVSLVIPYPADLLEAMEVIMNTGEPIYNIANGEIRIAWSEIETLNLNAGETLLSIRFRATEAFTGNLSVELQPNTESELADNQGEAILNAELTSMTILPLKSNGTGNEAAFIGLCSLYPNPARNIVYVKMELANQADITCELFDALGKSTGNLLEQKNSQGITLLNISTDQYKPGLYQLRITVSSKDKHVQFMKKLIIDR